MGEAREPRPGTNPANGTTNIKEYLKPPLAGKALNSGGFYNDVTKACCPPRACPQCYEAG